MKLNKYLLMTRDLITGNDYEKHFETKSKGFILQNYY